MKALNIKRFQEKTGDFYHFHKDFSRISRNFVV